MRVDAPEGQISEASMLPSWSQGGMLLRICKGRTRMPVCFLPLAASLTSPQSSKRKRKGKKRLKLCLATRETRWGCAYEFRECAPRGAMAPSRQRHVTGSAREGHRVASRPLVRMASSESSLGSV